MKPSTIVRKYECPWIAEGVKAPHISMWISAKVEANLIVLKEKDNLVCFAK